METVIDRLFDGRTVKEYLFAGLALSRRQVTVLKNKENGILLNGQRRTVRALLKEGDKLSLALEDEEAGDRIVPYDHPLDILYEDGDIIAVNKPPFMPTHPSLHHYDDTLANALAAYFSKKGVPFVFRAVNRLDRDTSGLVLVAKNKRACSALSRQITERSVQKKYLALLDGEMDGQDGSIEKRIERVADSLIMRRVSDERGEYALTRFKVLAHSGGKTLVLALPQTGRTHQLRVHFASSGHPITGDTLYGSASERIERQALHAFSLSFVHPGTQSEMTLFAPLPEDFLSLLKENGFEKTVYDPERILSSE